MGIPDRNLRLALEADGLGWLAELRPAYEQLGVDPSWETLEESVEPMPALEDLVADLPLEAAALASITRLTLDPDRVVYGCYPDWLALAPGHYVIHDLTGLDRCQRLAYLNLGNGLLEGCSLAPLCGLPLDELRLCADANYRDISAILELPLTRIRIANIGWSTQQDEWERVLAVLKQRGVH